MITIERMCNMKVVGFFPLFNMRKTEITALKEMFATKGFRYVATARSVDELKLILQQQDIQLIAIKDFNGKWNAADKLRFVMAISGLKWFHIDTEDIALLDDIKVEIMSKQQL